MACRAGKSREKGNQDNQRARNLPYDAKLKFEATLFRKKSD